ncbi:MAG: hypothetical protein Q8O67_34185 [Deltaproteobacteria bacterium]|nr:hypothetical protein [Deltaproteobacteria bacterium]
MMSSRVLIIALCLLPLSACSCAAPPEKAGDECDLNADEEPCPDGLVCLEDDDDKGACFVPLGGDCSGDAEDFCTAGLDCGDDVCGGRGASCATDEDCFELFCAELASGGNACHPPAQLRGQVIDGLDLSPVAGAAVVGLDIDGAAISKTAVTDVDGNYSLALTVKRNDDGSPLDVAATLRADARDYASFPGGIRTAIPVDLGTAAVDADTGAFVVDNAATVIALLPLPAAEQGRPVISGNVAAGGGGVLVVADIGELVRAPSAITDQGGDFTVFNVPAGTVTVSGYAAGLQLTPATVTVADADVEGVVLSESATGTGTVSGNIQIVNGGGGSVTSVVLVVDETFDDILQRGDVPRGLRAGDVDGAFTISGVPDGTYVVLAAFENDGLVRDPDENISGTDLVRVTVGDGAREVNLGESFKITGALDVLSPGADGIETVTAPPTFVFGNDSSEDGYTVEVIDAFGTVNWSSELPTQSGSSDISLPYGGPGLEEGMIYQLRVRSFRESGGGRSNISATEDLKGIFLFQP